MKKDVLKVVIDHPVTEYRCGARAGDQVRLKHDLLICDPRGRRADLAHAAGELWTVLQGTADKPAVVWLRQADGKTHTWSGGEEFLATFEIISS